MFEILRGPVARRPSSGVLILALVAALVAFSAGAQTPPKKVRIGYGGPIPSPWLALPGPLGYWRVEGLDVELFNARGSAQAIQQLIGAQADLAQVNSAPLVQAATNIGMLIRDVMLNTVIDWSLVVLEDGPIQNIRDIKGKGVGTSGLGGGGISLLKSLMQANGLDPDRDVTIYATGGPLQAAQALASNKVQGLFYWGSGIAAMEETGIKLRSFTDPEWRQLPGYSLAALHGTILRDPKTVEGLVRGAAKASLFAVTNPDCMRRVREASYQRRMAAGLDEVVAASADLRALAATIASMKLARDLSGGKEWGKSTPEQFGRLQDILLHTKQIGKKLVNPADYIIAVPDFFTRVNAFDHDAITAQAKACDIKM
jgi:NitT/TauT family transport system substrate-binding protein